MAAAMAVKVHKEVQIFKRICTQDSFGDHVEEVLRLLVFLLHKDQDDADICTDTYLMHLASILKRCPGMMQVRFPQAVCLTGVKVGAVPSHLGAERSASVDIFAKDLSTLGSARFACLAEGCELPESGTKAIRLEVSNLKSHS